MAFFFRDPLFLETDEYCALFGQSFNSCYYHYPSPIIFFSFKAVSITVAKGTDLSEAKNSLISSIRLYHNAD